MFPLLVVPWLLIQTMPAEIAINLHATATLNALGSPDFLAADGADVWVTNEGRVDKLQLGEPKPVASVSVPRPCGGMETGFGALWVANCEDETLYRIDLQTRRVAAVI